MTSSVATNHSWLAPELAPVLVAVIVLAAIGTTLLFLTGLVVYRRRRTGAYLLVTVILGLLVARSIVGLGTVFGIVPMSIHHLVEHGVDLLIAGLIIWTVYSYGPPVGETPSHAGTRR